MCINKSVWFVFNGRVPEVTPKHLSEWWCTRHFQSWERGTEGGKKNSGGKTKRDGLSVDEVGENWIGRKSGVSKSSDAADTPPRVFDLVSQSECERVLSFRTFCANGQVISLSLTHTKPTSLTRDARLHETILGCDKYYHTEWNLNKMNSWITIFFFFLHLCFPWCFKHESWGKWASLRKKSRRMIIR